MRFPVFIGLRRSRIFVVAICVMHAMAAGAFLALSWPWIWRVVPLVALAVSLWRVLLPCRVVALRLDQDGNLACDLRDGTRLPATLLPDSTVFSWLVVLRLRLDGERKALSLPLFQDHMSGDEFRTLRLWLRWCFNPQNDDFS